MIDVGKTIPPVHGAHGLDKSLGSSRAKHVINPVLFYLGELLIQSHEVYGGKLQHFLQFGAQVPQHPLVGLWWLSGRLTRGSRSRF